MTERKGNWFQTYTGRKFWALDPKPEDICIEDIAHSLSMLCRFNGHIKDFYNVAQHSILVTGVFGRLIRDTELKNNPKAYLCALLHDATEAYCGDMIRPIKINMPEYRHMEKTLWHCILKKFELEEAWVQSHLEEVGGLGPMSRYVYGYVKKADDIMLVTERRDLLVAGPGEDKNKWAIEEQVEPDQAKVIPMRAAESEHMFLDLFEKLVR